MKQSEYKKAKVQTKKQEAIELYKLGYSFREVSKTVGYSHQWVANAVKEDKNSKAVDN